MSKVLDVLKKSGGLLPETIADRAGMSVGAVLAELNKLEFDDKVSSLGGRYSLQNRSRVHLEVGSAQQSRSRNQKAAMNLRDVCVRFVSR
jgi:hypothetical protein